MFDRHQPDRTSRVETALVLRASALLAGIAALVLALGVVAYVTDRAPGTAALIPLGARPSIGPLFGSLAQWLPSFVHPFAFSLLTAAATEPIAKRPAYHICAAWWVVNVVFEFGQHPHVRRAVTEATRELFGENRLASSLASYLMRGTFDIGDLAAATAGALAAAAVLYLVWRRSSSRVC